MIIQIGRYRRNTVYIHGQSVSDKTKQKTFSKNQTALAWGTDKTQPNADQQCYTIKNKLEMKNADSNQVYIPQNRKIFVHYCFLPM